MNHPETFTSISIYALCYDLIIFGIRVMYGGGGSLALKGLKAFMSS